MLSELLITVIIITALTTFLALIMVIADRTIANYGQQEITINGEKKIVVDGGKPLLSSLKEKQIFIPSACGGKGSCGLCKIQVNSGAGEYLPTELPWIDPREREKNIRLSCQVKVKKPFDITIPRELFNIKQYKTAVESLVDLTHDIKQVTLKLENSEGISFKAGQFIQFEVPLYEMTDEPVYRAYSISSPPSRKDAVELEIRYVPDGLCTTYVHKYLKEGQKVMINGPYGDFFLRDSQRDIVCIAGGSGMAPIKSILLDMNEKKINRKAVYFFGARSKRDLFLVEEMQRLEKELPDFRFIPSLSQPEESDSWEGETGLITECVEKHVKNGENAEAYLCGSPGMINACVDVLTNRCGVKKDLIFYDKFS